MSICTVLKAESRRVTSPEFNYDANPLTNDWVAQINPQNSGGEQLSSCLRDALRPFLRSTSFDQYVSIAFLGDFGKKARGRDV